MIIEGKRKNITLIFIYALGSFIQSSLWINRDVSWDMIITERFLSGGKYIQDFFEVSPPAIFYLYALPVALAKFMSLSSILIFRLYVFFLASLSMGASYVLLKKIFLDKDRYLVNVLLITVGIIFLILPLEEFGQRDHLLIILTMPYFLTVAYRLQGGQMNPSYAIAIGLFAGLGFAIKPFFLITPFLIELYYIFCKRNSFAFIRWETATIFVWLLAYLFFTCLWQKNYIEIIAPLLSSFYYESIKSPLLLMAKYNLACFCYLMILFYFIRLPYHAYRAFCTVMMLALVGFLLAYFLQQTTWFYHIIPAVSMAILLGVLLFSLLLSQTHHSRNEYIALSLFTFLFFTFLIYRVSVMWIMLIFKPMVFYGFMTICFTLLLYQAQVKKNYYKIAGSIFCILLITGVFSYMTQRTSWHEHQFLMTVLLLFLLFTLFVSTHRRQKSESLLIALSIMFFSLPTFVLYNIYGYARGWDARLYKTMAFIHQNAFNQPVYYFSTTMSIAFPTFLYAGAIPATRFAHLVLMPSLIKNRLPTDKHYGQQQIGQTLYHRMVTEDLNRYQPAFIFINAHDLGTGDDKTKKPIDFIQYFSQDAQFRAAFRSYRYLTTIKEDAGFTLDVYQRMTNNE